MNIPIHHRPGARLALPPLAPLLTVSLWHFQAVMYLIHWPSQRTPFPAPIAVESGFGGPVRKRQIGWSISFDLHGFFCRCCNLEAQLDDDGQHELRYHQMT